MRRYLLTSIIAIIGLVFTFTQPAQANSHLEENSIGFSNIRELYQDLGAVKLFNLMLTPKSKRGVYYHYVSETAAKTCEEPNAWYFEGLIEDDICQQMKANGLNVVCNTACPESRKTGIKCGLAHECCRPADSIEDPVDKLFPFRCSPDGTSSGIQYCSF
ncbi:MAG: hypothetical protein UZ22_OP11002000497 [Microgenomates bacterium OLB23]|nr:MAG: hypothetical protein UZ22_OP11002000497 [Microgenomates bacterium OLB23]